MGTKYNITTDRERVAEMDGYADDEHCDYCTRSPKVYVALLKVTDDEYEDIESVELTRWVCGYHVRRAEQVMTNNRTALMHPVSA